MRGVRSWLFGAAIVACALLSPALAQFDTVIDPAARIRRLVHTFDFDERDQGNLEDVPLYWIRFEGKSFPRFVTGAFDTDVGHDAPPSFYVDPVGRNASYRYTGPALRVVPTSDYYIGGWIRPDRLAGARAALSAYYLDAHGLPIWGSQRFSPLVGGDDGDDWRYVEIHMPAGSAEATHIGLTVWVVQSTVWNNAPVGHRHIEYRDVHGGAWFDDIRVYRLPSATLEVANPGNVFVAPDPPVITVEVSDYETTGLSASLEVRSSHGRVEWSSNIPVQVGERSKPRSIELSELEPGHYTVILRMNVGGLVAASQHESFAVLPESSHNRGAARPFGVVLDGPPTADCDAEVALLAGLNVGALKIPVWPRDAQHSTESWSSKSLDALLKELIRRRVMVIGQFAGPPLELVGGVGANTRSLVDILLDDPEGWRGSLTRVVAPYSTVFRSWQIGADDDAALIDDPRLGDALARVRQQMLRVMTAPRLAAPRTAVDDSQGERLAAEEITVAIPPSVQPAWIHDHLEPIRALGYEDVSAYLAPPAAGEWDRLARLSQWARGIIEARHAGVDVVYVPQLWSDRQARAGKISEPSEEFVIYRSIVDMLHDARPGERIQFAEGLQVRTFKKGRSTVWAMWDDAATNEGTVHHIQLGAATRQVDLWGRSEPLLRDEEGRHQVRVGPLPIFVDGVESWLTDLMAQITILPAQVDFSIGYHQHRIQVSNTGRETLSGVLRLLGPDRWEISPHLFAINVPSGESAEFPVDIRFGSNESAGTKRLTAQLLLDQPADLYLQQTLTLGLELQNIDVWAYAVMEGDRLVLRHGLTNRTDQSLSFRAYATAPGRSRQNRVIAKLEPGQSVSNEYHFPNASALRSRTVRLSLKEVGGPRIHNLDVRVP
ncbi:MAG: hypothetical protein IID37_07240 [Planctomycetes bacterium]|nr:hypothetical protein [Planctomycetota bacterium]